MNSSEVQKHSDSAVKREKRNSEDFERELAEVYKTKTTERLVLGSALVPIPIVYNDNHTTLAFDLPHDSRNYVNTTAINYRQARVVGGEDGENGEWCWQVALINSLNQYLCGGALIGEFNATLYLITCNLLTIYVCRHSVGFDRSSLCYKYCAAR
jgi:hypothetical protein